MDSIRLDTTVDQDGRIQVPGVRAGEEVEVIVLLKHPRAKSYPLRGTGGKFKAPFEAVIPPSDWDDVS